MDTLNPGLAWRKREDQTVARKTYSEEFRGDAVELYRSTPGATVVGIAADLGIMDSTLSAWLKAAGVPVCAGTPDPRTGPLRRARRLTRSSPGCGLGSPNSRRPSGS